MSDDDESDWLHTNDAYNMHAKQGGTDLILMDIPILVEHVQSPDYRVI
jgi:hypothetical protein